MSFWKWRPLKWFMRAIPRFLAPSILKSSQRGKFAPEPNAGVFNVKIKDPGTIDVDYVYQYLAAPFLMKYANAKSTGGTIKHLNQNILIDFPVPLPRKREQVKLAELLNGLDNTITLHQRKLEKLQELKKGYLQKMFCWA